MNQLSFLFLMNYSTIYDRTIYWAKGFWVSLKKFETQLRKGSRQRVVGKNLLAEVKLANQLVS